MGTTTAATSPLIVLESGPGSLTTRSSSLAMAAANETLLVVLDKVISPNASNYTDLLMQQQPAEVNMSLMALKGTLLLLIILLTITGNLLVLVAIFMNPNLRTTTNYFIVNLAIADLLLGASVLPFSATLELLDKQWYFGQIFCNVWAATDVLCCTASINSLCVISVDRYIGVTRPLTYSSIVTHRRAVTTCVVVWVLSFFISVGPLFGWRDPPNPDLKYSCEVTKQKGYVIFSVLFSFYIPTLVILVVYQRIYRAATRQTKFLETGVKIVKSGGGTGNSGNGELTLRVHQGNSKSSSGSQLENSSNPKVVTMGLQGRLAKFKRQKKAAKTLGIVVGVYFICWFPFFFILPLGSFCEACTVPPLLFDVIFWTGYFNSCLNPFIYATTSREYNRAFRTVLRCNWLCRGTGSREHNATDYQWSNSKTVTYTIRGSSSPQRQSTASTMRPSPLPNHHNFKDIA